MSRQNPERGLHATGIWGDQNRNQDRATFIFASCRRGSDDTRRASNPERAARQYRVVIESVSP